MEKAKLYVDYLYVGALAGFAVEVQFNPTELSITRTTNWEGIPVPERDFYMATLRGTYFAPLVMAFREFATNFQYKSKYIF